MFEATVAFTCRKFAVEQAIPLTHTLEALRDVYRRRAKRAYIQHQIFDSRIGDGRVSPPGLRSLAGGPVRVHQRMAEGQRIAANGCRDDEVSS